MTIELRGAEAGGGLAREVPFSGITVEERGGQPQEISVLAGPREGQIYHRIPAPEKLLLRRTPEGPDEGLRAESAGGLRITLRFRAAALPETVDGIAPELGKGGNDGG